MEHVTVQGERIPAVGLGTWRMSGESCRRAVESALDLGYRHLDTAQSYGNEREVGRAIAASAVARDELFLTTKVWVTKARYHAVIESTRASLRRLDVDYLDLLLLHWPNPLVSIEETLSAMGALQDEGVVRHVGVSNFGLDRLRTARGAAGISLFANQVQLHPYAPKKDLRRYCREHDILLTAYSPLGHGGVLRDSVLHEIGRKYGKTPAQVAIRWCLQHDHVAAIPKSTNPEHQRENLDIFDFELSADERARIERPSRVRTVVAFLRGRFGI